VASMKLRVFWDLLQYISKNSELQRQRCLWINGFCEGRVPCDVITKDFPHMGA